MIHHLPSSERPRERLEIHGAKALSLPELLAILLRTGTKGKSAIQLGEELLARFGGLPGLLEASIDELTEIKGLGKTKAIQLKAAFEITCRKDNPTTAVRCTSQVAYELLKEQLQEEKREMLVVVLKDIKGRFIRKETVSIGTLSAVLFHPREVFHPAVRHKAHSMILAHNHPSGDPTPSKADLQLTRCLIESSKVMGIHVDDHIIVGRQSYISILNHSLK